MEKDPKLLVYLLATFGLMITGVWLRFNATARLAKWLFRHRRDVWMELGSPGSTFFKGESDNPYLKRTTALNAMYKSMPLHDYKPHLSDTTAESCIKQYHLGGIMAGVSMALFAFGIIYGVACEQRRPDDAVKKVDHGPAKS